MKNILNSIYFKVVKNILVSALVIFIIDCSFTLMNMASTLAFIVGIIVFSLSATFFIKYISKQLK